MLFRINFKLGSEMVQISIQNKTKNKIEWILIELQGTIESTNGLLNGVELGDFDLVILFKIRKISL